MPRKSEGPRLWLEPARYDGDRLVRASTWVIRDGSRKRSTGCAAGQRAEAELRLAEYVIARYRPQRARERHPAQILIDDALNIYLSDIAPTHSRPQETAARLLALSDFFTGKTLADINGDRCRAYVKHRGSSAAARRELEDLRAAINHHRREGLCSEVVSVVLPEKSPPRERWLTREEAAGLILAAWRYREI